MSLEQQIAVAIADCRFDKALSAAFEEKVKSSPVLGLSFLEKLGASLAAGGSHTAVPTSSSGPVLGLQSGMSEAHAAVLISYVVRVMRAMSFEECTQSAQQLDTTLQLWARLAASATTTSHAALGRALTTLLSVLLLQTRTVSDPLFLLLLKDPLDVVRGLPPATIPLRALASFADAAPASFCAAMDRVLVESFHSLPGCTKGTIPPPGPSVSGNGGGGGSGRAGPRSAGSGTHESAQRAAAQASVAATPNGPPPSMPQPTAAPSEANRHRQGHCRWLHYRLGGHSTA